jgi:hypothetical protein
MLSAAKQLPRKEYVVKFGYVYSDGTGNNYRAGEIVSLTEKEYDLSRHRVKPYIGPSQVEEESGPRPVPSLYQKPTMTPIKEEVEESSEKVQGIDEGSLAGVFGSKNYEVK